MHEIDRHRALADGRRDALHRVEANVTGREHAGHARLQRERRTRAAASAGRPSASAGRARSPRSPCRRGRRRRRASRCAADAPMNTNSQFVCDVFLRARRSIDERERLEVTFAAGAATTSVCSRTSTLSASRGCARRDTATSTSRASPTGRAARRGARTARGSAPPDRPSWPRRRRTRRRLGTTALRSRSRRSTRPARRAPRARAPRACGTTHRSRRARCAPRSRSSPKHTARTGPRVSRPTTSRASTISAPNRVACATARCVEVRARQALREPEVVLDRRALPGLPARRLAFDDDRLQTFGGAVHRGRETGRPAADDAEVVERLLGASCAGRARSRVRAWTVPRSVSPSGMSTSGRSVGVASASSCSRSRFVVTLEVEPHGTGRDCARGTS